MEQIEAAARVASAIVLLWCATAGTAAAFLESRDDPDFGPDSITFDSLSGLEWLDVTESAGRSYNDLIGLDGSNEFQEGGDFAGFRHASNPEVFALIEHAEIEAGRPEEASQEDFLPVTRLQELLGVTIARSDDTVDFESTWGITGASTGTEGFRHRFVVSRDLLDSTAWAGLNGANLDGGSDRSSGNFLVRRSREIAVVHDAAFAHDFEDVVGNDVLSLLGPTATKSAAIVADTTDPIDAASTQHIETPSGSAYVTIDTNTQLQLSRPELSFSIFYNDRGDNGAERPGNTARLLSSFSGTGAVAADDTIFDLITSSDSRRLRLITASETFVSTAALPFEDAQWHHAGVVFDRGTVTFYFDGAPLGTPLAHPSATSVPEQNRGWFLLEDATAAGLSAEYFDGGDYDEAALWYRALSEREMNALFEQGIEAVLVPEPAASATALAVIASLAALRRRPRRPKTKGGVRAP